LQVKSEVRLVCLSLVYCNPFAKGKTLVGQRLWARAQIPYQEPVREAAGKEKLRALQTRTETTRPRPTSESKVCA